MKIFSILLMGIVVAYGQQEEHRSTASCCGPTATEEFAAFGSNALFAGLHETPETPRFQVTEGMMKQIPTSDSLPANIFIVPSKKKTNKVVFMFHEWWGLNEYIKREAVALQNTLNDVTVIALDLYDGNVATDRAAASEFMQKVNDDRAMAIIDAALHYAGKDARIATIGWCFGGGWSLRAAIALGTQAAGCVIYYGMPEKDVKKLETLRCDVLGIFASQDGFITPAVVAEFEKNMKSVKKNLTVKTYDAVHAFANPSNPKYDKEKADDAHGLAVDFLKRSFSR